MSFVAMFFILGDGEDSESPSRESVDGSTVADSVDTDPPDVEQRRRPASSVSPASVADSRAPGRRPAGLGDNEPEPGESGAFACCTIGVDSDADDSADVNEAVNLRLLDYPESVQAPSRPYLRGKWEGVMTAIGEEPDGAPSVVPPFDEARGRYGFRLDIRETTLVMYFQNGSNWIPLGEGQDLRTNEQGRSAVVITTLGNANGGIEVMMLNIVRWNEGTIAVHMSRVIGAAPGGGTVPTQMSSMGILDRAQF